MNKKYWETTRKQDIADAKHILAIAKRHCGNVYMHTDGLRVARLFIDNIRKCNAELKAYN